MTPISRRSAAQRMTVAECWCTATKRLEDVVVSAIEIVIIAPVFAVIAIAIRLEDGGRYCLAKFGLAGRGHHLKLTNSVR